MNRTGAALLILLMLQLGVIAVLYQEDLSGDSNLTSTALMDTGAYVVDDITIANGKGANIRLRRVGERWLLPDLNNLPADTERVVALLEQLTATDVGWSVAHSLAARQRFQVADYHFRRKLVLSALERELGTVFLGTSPGFRQIHARNDRADDIYAVDLNLFEIPVDAGKWLDPRLLQMRSPVAIDADGYSLQRTSEHWQLGSGETLDQRELGALLDALRQIQVQGIASAKTQAAVANEEAALILRVQALAGTVELQLFRHQDKHYVRSSEYPYLFVITAYEFDKLTGIDNFLLSGEQ